MFGIGPSWIGHNGLWVPFRILSCIGLLELMGWALVFGPSEERVKWTFTLSVGQLDLDSSYGLWTNFSFGIIDDVGMGIFRIASPSFYLRFSAA